MNRILTIVVTFLLAASGYGARVIRVEAGSAESLLAAISEANRLNGDSATARPLFILIPDGTYDLGERTLTTLSGHRVALIGQSMEHTVIVNRPPVEQESIRTTATLRLMTSDTYLQDLTLKNELDYYRAGGAGRAVSLHDKGTRTVCRRVRLLSHQDTYYSDNEAGQMYLENCEIHGTVDFICGPADVYFNRCAIVTERRTPDGSGRNVIAAPRTEGTPWGYVFESCVVYNRLSEFHWARGWKATPRCTWLNTTLMTPVKLLETRFDPAGMRTVANNFKEYGTRDAEGRDITPRTNVVTFALGDERNAVETILTAEEAAEFRIEKIFPGWRPEKIAERLTRQARRLRHAAGWE